MTVAVYVDDEHDDPDTQRIARFLQRNKFRCDLVAPTHDFAEIANLNADFFLLDYNLAAFRPDEKHIGYHGNSLATEIRNRNPTRPIILVSRTQIIDSPNLHLIGDRSGVDLVLFKRDILNYEDRALQCILTLLDGYGHLAALQESKDPKWSDVLDSLRADKDGSSRIREAYPPIDKEGRCYIPSVIRWIRTVLMEYPGILYDSLHASARLGITEESFVSEPMQGFVEGAVYTGPLAGFGKRWWADQLVEIATNAIIDTNLDGPISLSFIEAYSRTGRGKQQKLEPSLCVVDERPGADEVCYILQQPVKRENSIIYYPDSRPPIMDSARVSIKAIKEKDSFDESFVEASSIDLVNEIWNRNGT